MRRRGTEVERPVVVEVPCVQNDRAVGVERAAGVEVYRHARGTHVRPARVGYRRVVDLVDGDRDPLEVTEVGRPVVDRRERDRVAALLRLARRPDECARRCVERRTRRQAAHAQRHRVRRIVVGVARRDRERQFHLFVDHSIADQVEHRGSVDLVDGDRDRLGITEVGRSVVGRRERDQVAALL